MFISSKTNKQTYKQTKKNLENNTIWPIEMWFCIKSQSKKKKTGSLYSFLIAALTDYAKFGWKQHKFLSEGQRFQMGLQVFLPSGGSSRESVPSLSRLIKGNFIPWAVDCISPTCFHPHILSNLPASILYEEALWLPGVHLDNLIYLAPQGPSCIISA